MNTENTLLIFLLIFLMISLTLFFVNPPLTGYATEASTASTLTISEYFAITLSDNLASGIDFGTVNVLPTLDVNASNNYDGASSATTLFTNVSDDSNRDVEFCINANSGLHDSAGGGIIGIGNQTYLNATTSDATLPGPVTSSVQITNSFVKSSAPTAPGNATYYRFWLDVPSGTEVGSYNNTIRFKGVVEGSVC